MHRRNPDSEAKLDYLEAYTRLDELLDYRGLHGEPALTSDVVITLSHLCFNPGKLSTLPEGIPYGGYENFSTMVNYTLKGLTDGVSTAN